MKSEPDEEVFDVQLDNSPMTRINNVKAVGSYALTIVWEDSATIMGFTTGIIYPRYVRAKRDAKYGR